MKSYAVTFGRKYKREKHPYCEKVDPDGWFKVEAKDKDEAREAAIKHLGLSWAFIYSISDGEFNECYYPMGELAQIDLQNGIIMKGSQNV